MKKLLIFAILILFGTGSIQAQAIKRVPKKDKKDSSKTESVVNKDNNTPEAKEPPKQDSFKPPLKDEFIDRDGAGINDQMTQSKPPAVKKQPPPKAPEIKPRPEPQKPSAEPPKIEKKEKDSKSSEKKSRR